LIESTKRNDQSPDKLLELESLDTDEFTKAVGSPKVNEGIILKQQVKLAAGTDSAIGFCQIFGLLSAASFSSRESTCPLNVKLSQ
jgi:hypothetical protein